MSIVPLPVFEADADPRHRGALSDQQLYDQLEPPKTIVVRFGVLKLVAELPYDGEAKPGCGSKLVARTHRGTEVVEMLTTTCENAGCAKSVTRHEMMDYIDNSGGKEFPFNTEGRILRVATIEDLNKQSSLAGRKPEYIKTCRRLIEEFNLPMKLVEVEPILGEELLTFYFMSQERVDFRELVRQLAGEFKARIEMRQVGARDEARLVADYERCGQHCCCKQFLKVLKPISMKSAKLQKATLDPLKISGRCGRLMCCLRYEDQSYRDLKKKLPHRNSRVGTAEGPGVVVDGKILVQLVLVRLDEGRREIAVPVEELMDPDKCPKPGEKAPEPDPLRGLSTEETKDKTDDRKRSRRRRRGKGRQQDAYRKKSEQVEKAEKADPTAQDKESQAAPASEPPSDGAPRKRRRRRRRRPPRGNSGQNTPGDS